MSYATALTAVEQLDPPTYTQNTLKPPHAQVQTRKRACVTCLSEPITRNAERVAEVVYLGICITDVSDCPTCGT